MMKDFELIENSHGNIERKIEFNDTGESNKDEKTWMIRTEDYQLWGPFSYNELFNLSKNKKLSRYDWISKSCEAFEPITEIDELSEIVASIPEAIFEETTEKNLQEFTEATIKENKNSLSAKSITNLFNLSKIPLNTILWVVLFCLVTAYCVYYVNKF